jgi:TRAP-type mannitol/chloroaromatic compound transport system substrate-binding protein
MYPGFHEPGSALSVGVNASWFGGLSDSDKALIEACCTAENDVMAAEYNARNGDALTKLINEHGVQLHKFPDEVFNEIAKVADEVVRNAADDDLGQRIIDSYFAFRESVRGWTALSDQAYANARSLALG